MKIALHLSLLVMVQVLVWRTSLAAPADEIPVEDGDQLLDDDHSEDSKDDPGEGRTFGLLRTPLTFASRWAHRLGYLLDPTYVSLGYHGVSLQPGYPVYPGIGYPSNLYGLDVDRKKRSPSFLLTGEALKDPSEFRTGHKYRYE